MRRASRTLAVLFFASSSAAPGFAQEGAQQPVRTEEKDPRHVVRVHGTAVAIDRDGSAHAKEDGSLQIYHKVDGLIDVVVHGGEWEAWTSVAAPLLAGQLELGGRSVTLERTPFRPPFDDAIELRGPWIEDLVVHVVYAATHAELDHLEIVNQERDGGYASHPGFYREDQVVAKDEKSPLKLSKFGSWFIRAPGHAWQVFHFLDTKKAKNRLELPAACSLVIDAKGLDPKGPAKLRIEPGNGSVELITLDPSHGPHVELDALPPGRVHARAFLDFHMKPWFWHTVTLGEAVVELAPKSPAHAEFVVGPPPPGLHEDGTVDRTGIVTLPDGDARKPFSGDGSFEYQFVKVDEDEKGRIGRGWSGIFEQTADGYDMQRKYTANITGGKFELRPPYGTHLHVTSLTLSSRSYALGSGHDLFETVPEPIEIALTANAVDVLPVTPTLLHVVSAETKVELSHIEIVKGIGWRQSDMSHPGRVKPEQLLVQDGVSPLPMPTKKAVRDGDSNLMEDGGFMEVDGSIFWIRAEGYAWTRIKQRPMAGGERVVELARSCELSVKLEPNVVPKDAVLRVWVEPQRDGSSGEPSLLDARLSALGYDINSDDEGDDPPTAMEEAPATPREPGGVAELSEEDAMTEALASGTPAVDLSPDPKGTTRIDGLPCRTMAVAVEVGEWFREPERFGLAKVDGRKGGLIELTLAVRAAAPPPDPVPLAGTLFIPAEWGAIEAQLNVKPERGLHFGPKDEIHIDVRDMEHSSAEPGLLSWTAGKLPPGVYSLSLGNLGFERTIHLGSEGDLNERIVVDPPADVTVHLVDAMTGDPAPIDRLLWYRAGASFDSGSNAQTSPSEAATAGIRFRAPIGALELHVWEQPYDLRRERVDVRAGKNEFTLKLERECGVRLRLRCQGAVIPWDDEAFHVGFRRLDGKGGNHGWGEEEGAQRFTLTSPGRYRVTFGKFPGFKAVPPKELDVGRGQIVDLTVELEVDR